jgi:hypothetical protein
MVAHRFPTSARLGRLTAAAVLVALALTGGARLSEAGGAAALDARYTLYFGGLPLADLELSHANGAADYASQFSIRTKGLVEVFLRYRGKASVAGQMDEDGELRPLTYDASFKRKNEVRASQVRFAPATGEVVEIEITKQNKPQESDVPPEMWANVIDPLTGFMALRQHLGDIRAGAGNPIAVQIFDGRLRYDLEAELVGRQTVRFDGQDWPALRVQATLRPLAGFNRNDLRRSGFGEEGLQVELVVSDDELLLPISARSLNTRLPILFQLQGCRGGCSSQLEAAVDAQAAG